MMFIRIISKIDDVVFAIATAFLSVGCVLVVLNAISRKFFNMGFPWAEELSTYLVVMMLFLSLPHLERLDRHLCIGILMSRLKSDKSKNIFRIIRGAWTIFIMVVLLRYGYTLVQTIATNNVVTYILKWPRAPIFTILLIGFALIIVVFICIIFIRKGGMFDDNTG